MLLLIIQVYVQIASLARYLLNILGNLSRSSFQEQELAGNNIQIRCFKACLIKLLLTKVEQDIGKPGQASPLCLKERENGDREICVDRSYVLDLKGHSQSAETPQERAQEINVNFINKYLFPISTPSSTGAPVSKSDKEEARECRNPVM